MRRGVNPFPWAGQLTLSQMRRGGSPVEGSSGGASPCPADTIHPGTHPLSPPSFRPPRAGIHPQRRGSSPCRRCAEAGAQSKGRAGGQAHAQQTQSIQAPTLSPLRLSGRQEPESIPRGGAAHPVADPSIAGAQSKGLKSGMAGASPSPPWQRYIRAGGWAVSAPLA